MQSGMPLPASKRDIIDTLEDVPLPAHDFPWLAVAIAAVLALLIFGVYFYRRRRRPAPVESAEDGVRRRLRELAGLAAPDPRAFHAELAALLMHYAEERLGLRGTRLTSAEVLREFRRNGVMSAAWQDRLAEFLRDCDRAKFAPKLDAGWSPPDRVAQCRDLFDQLAAVAAAAPRLASPWEEWGNAAV